MEEEITEELEFSASNLTHNPHLTAPNIGHHPDALHNSLNVTSASDIHFINCNDFDDGNRSPHKRKRGQITKIKGDKTPIERKGQDKILHNAAERRRKQRFNAKLAELHELLPPLASQTKPSKMKILERSVEHLKQLIANVEELQEANQLLALTVQDFETKLKKYERKSYDQYSLSPPPSLPTQLDTSSLTTTTTTPTNSDNNTTDIETMSSSCTTPPTTSTTSTPINSPTLPLLPPSTTGTSGTASSLKQQHNYANHIKPAISFLATSCESIPTTSLHTPTQHIQPPHVFQPQQTQQQPQHKTTATEAQAQQILPSLRCISPFAGIVQRHNMQPTTRTNTPSGSPVATTATPLQSTAMLPPARPVTPTNEIRSQAAAMAAAAVAAAAATMPVSKSNVSTKNQQPTNREETRLIAGGTVSAFRASRRHHTLSLSDNTHNTHNTAPTLSHSSDNPTLFRYSPPTVEPISSQQAQHPQQPQHPQHPQHQHLIHPIPQHSQQLLQPHSPQQPHHGGLLLQGAQQPQQLPHSSPYIQRSPSPVNPNLRQMQTQQATQHPQQQQQPQQPQQQQQQQQPQHMGQDVHPPLLGNFVPTGQLPLNLQSDQTGMVDYWHFL